MSEAEIEANKIREQAAKDQEIKEKYKAVIKEQDGDKVAYFRKPSRLAVGAFLSMQNENLVSACEPLFYDCIIKEVSDAEHFATNDDAFLGVMPALIKLVGVKKSISTTL